MEEKWEKLGLKAGLEVHQQLNTGKLFCRCPSILREENPDLKIKRYLKPVASELGEFDKAALEAYERGLGFVYEAYYDTTCELELDEEPPKEADAEALETTLKIALMCNSKILDQVFVMRKLVIDGSNTSGFQRTALVSVGGELQLSNKKVGILSIALEEDAARPMERTENEVVYRVDRLGIPLIELATAPDLKTPEEVKECAKKIGEIFRRTCKAKRGLGTIRQDVNISIAKGARIEIKGVQNLEMIDQFVRREAQRQNMLIEIMDEMKKRKISGKEFENVKVEELSNIFSGTECKFLKEKKVFGIRLSKMQSLLGKEIQPGRRFGTELAGHVKARAGLKGIIHSDELPGYGVSEREIERIRQKCDCVMNDGFVMAQAEKEKAEKALRIVLERCKQTLAGIPEETRNALDDGNSEYSRPLSGAARMYPETDLAPIIPNADYISELKKQLPKTVDERKKLYSKQGLSEKLVDGMKLSNYACFFENLLKKGFNATTAATLILDGLIQLRREGVKGIPQEKIETVLLLEKEKKIPKGLLLEFLRQWSKTPEIGTEEILKTMKVERIGEGELEKVVAAIVDKNKKLVEEQGMRAIGALMGDAMKQLKGKANGEEISRVLREEIAKKAK